MSQWIVFVELYCYSKASYADPTLKTHTTNVMCSDYVVA